MDDAAWDHSTYTKNRDRLIEHEVVRALFGRVMQQAEEAQAAFRRAFQRRWHPDPGLGLAQELRAQGRAAAAECGQPAAIRRSISRARSAATTPTPAPPIRTRKMFAKSNKAGIAAGLSGSRADGKPQQAGGRHAADAGHRDSGSAKRRWRCWATLPGTQPKTVGADKHFDTDRIRQRLPRAQRHPACGAEHLRVRHQDRQACPPQEPHRRAHHPASRATRSARSFAR